MSAVRAVATIASCQPFPSPSVICFMTAETTVNQTTAADPARSWTFLTNHSHVLIVLDKNPGVVLREVAVQVGITERAVQRIIQDLEEGGFILRTRVGRQNRYEVLQDRPLRHPIESHRRIGDLLELITGTDSTADR